MTKNLSLVSCSNVGWRYPQDNSLFSEQVLGKTNCVIHWIEIYPLVSVIYLLACGADGFFLVRVS